MAARLSYRRLIWPAVLALAATALGVSGPAEGVGRGWLPETVTENLHLGAGTVAWLALAWGLARLFDLTVKSGERPVPRLLIDMVTIVLFLLAGIAILAQVFHQPVGALVTTSGVLVAVLGFSLKELIGDIFAGIAINLESPYAIGDWLELQPGGQVARVVEINWRATRLVTLDQTMVVVPNGQIAKSRFVNYNRPQRHFRAQIGLVLEHDLPNERIRRLLTTAARRVPTVLASPAPDTIVESFTDHGLRYVVRFYVSDYDRMVSTRSQVAIAIQRHLRLAGIAVRHGRQDLTISRGDGTGSGDPLHRRIRVLHHVELFRDLDESDLGELAKSMQTRTIGRGSVVVRAGEQGRSLFVVVEGVLEVRGEPGVIATLSAGDVFGEMSLLTGDPRSANVAATAEATLYEISDHQLRPILHRRPELAEALGAIIEERQQANLARPTEAAETTVPLGHSSVLGRIRDFFGLS
jgi:small-conductance mechanosensitive channel